MTAMFLHNFDALVTTDYLDTRFTEFETRIEANMDKRFTAMEASMDKRFNAMETSVDKRFSAMGASVDQRFTSVDQQFLRLESSMDVQFAAINTELRWLKWLIVTCIAATVWPSLSGLIQG